MSNSTSRLINIHVLRTLIINAVTFSVVLGLAANRRRNRDLAVRRWPAGREAPVVNIIISARNEERNVLALLETLLAQSYPPGCWGITLVDDGSADRTADIARSLAEVYPQLEVISTPDLPQGWTGKNHAMYTGYRASPEQAEWLLFVDADTRHTPDMLSSVVLRALETDTDLLSLVIDVQMETFWERVLVPQVGELYTLLVGTMDQVNSESNKAAANGQFMLIKRDLYGELGALAEVTGDVAEDRALASACKSRGYSVRLEYGRELVSARVYSSLRELWAGYSKTLFWASGHNTTRALIVALALAMYALIPPIAFIFALANRSYTQRQRAMLHAPLQILPMLALRAVICRNLGVPIIYAFTYPLGVAVGDAMLLYSLYRVLSGKGVEWKGRVYGRGEG